jgi:atypical dual specificity phosphatase
MEQIRPLLFLGDITDITKEHELQTNKIEQVISLAPEHTDWIVERCQKLKLRFQIFTIHDGDETPPETMKRIMATLLKAQNNGEVTLVHCSAGISRSPAIVIAYLMKTEKMSWDAACECVAEKRPVIFPHPNLKRSVLKYLKVWPYTLRHKESE